MTPRQIAAALTIAAVPVFGNGGLAHAAPQDQPWGPGADGLVHLPDGLCYQPLSNPPAHVPCDSTRATTPYETGVTYPDDPAPHDPGDGYVPEAAASPPVPVVRQARPRTIAVVVALPDAVPMRWELQHGA